MIESSALTALIGRWRERATLSNGVPKQGEGWAVMAACADELQRALAAVHGQAKHDEKAKSQADREDAGVAHDPARALSNVGVAYCARGHEEPQADCEACQVVHGQAPSLDISLVEKIAAFVEGLRNGFASTTEPVGKVARLIRERFSEAYETRDLSRVDAPTRDPLQPPAGDSRDGLRDIGAPATEIGAAPGQAPPSESSYYGNALRLVAEKLEKGIDAAGAMKLNAIILNAAHELDRGGQAPPSPPPELLEMALHAEHSGSANMTAEVAALILRGVQGPAASTAPNGLYGESHLTCHGDEHVYPRSVSVPCQCGATARTASTPEPEGPAASWVHHGGPGIDPTCAECQRRHPELTQGPAASPSTGEVK